VPPASIEARHDAIPRIAALFAVRGVVCWPARSPTPTHAQSELMRGDACPTMRSTECRGPISISLRVIHIAFGRESSLCQRKKILEVGRDGRRRRLDLLRRFPVKSLRLLFVPGRRIARAGRHDLGYRGRQYGFRSAATPASTI